MDSDLEEGEIKEDVEDSGLSVEKGRRRRQSPVRKPGLKKAVSDHGASTVKVRRKDGRILEERSRSRKSPVNGRMNAGGKVPSKVSNAPTRIRRLRMDSISKILNSRRGNKRRNESVQDSRFLSSNSFGNSLNNVKRSTKDTETKENKSYGQVSNSVNRTSKFSNDKRGSGSLHLTEVERNEMISSLENLTRRRTNSTKNGMSDISDTSDDDRSVVSIEPPAKPLPELITIDDSPDSEEDVEALQLRKQIIQDLMSKYENSKAVGVKEGLPTDRDQNEDEEPYSPVDEEIGHTSLPAQRCEMIASWLEEAKKLNVEYPALSISAPNLHSSVSKPDNVVDNLQPQGLVQYPLPATGSVTSVNNTYSTAIIGNTPLYSNNLFLPQSHQLGCGDVDMRLFSFQAANTHPPTSVPLQYTSVMAPDLFKPPQVGPNPNVSSFLPQTSVSLISDPFGRSFPLSDFAVPVQQQKIQFPYTEPFVEQSTLNYINGSLPTDTAVHWNQFVGNSLSQDMPGLQILRPPLPDSAPPLPPPPPPMETLPSSVHIPVLSPVAIPEPRVPSPSAPLLFPAPQASSLPAPQLFPGVLAEAQKQSELMLAESKDIDDRAKAYASTFEILNMKNPASNVENESGIPSRKPSGKSVVTHSKGKRGKEPISSRRGSSSSDLKTNDRVSRTNRSSERTGSKAVHRRESSEQYRRRSHSRSRRRESNKGNKTDVHSSEGRKRRDSSLSPLRHAKISKTDSNASSGRRHSTPEPFSPVSCSLSVAENSAALSVQSEKEVIRPKTSEKSMDAIGSEIIISVNNENAIVPPPCEAVSTVSVVEPVPVSSEKASDFPAYGIDDEEILRAQLLLDMARKKTNSVPPPVVSSVASKLPATVPSFPVSIEQPKLLPTNKAQAPMPSLPLLYVKDNRPTILKSVSNPRSKNRQIVRVANVAPNSLSNLRLQKTIINNAKSHSGPNNLHRIQRTVINTNLLKKNVYNKNADPVMRHLQITVPNKAVKPLIIPAGRDDSSSEDEAHEVEISKRPTSSPKEVVGERKSQSGSAQQVLPADFEMSLNNLLRTSRQQTSKPSSTPASSSEAVKHLPQSKQEEYMRLKRQLDAYERKIQKKERAKQGLQNGSAAVTKGRQKNHPETSVSASKFSLPLPIQSLSLLPLSTAEKVGEANQVQTSEAVPGSGQKPEQHVPDILPNKVQKLLSSSAKVSEAITDDCTIAVTSGTSATSTTPEAVVAPLVVCDEAGGPPLSTNAMEITDEQSHIQLEVENSSVPNCSSAAKPPAEEGSSKEGNLDEQNLLEDDDDANYDQVADYVSPENEYKLLQSDEDGVASESNVDVIANQNGPTQLLPSNDNDNESSIETVSENVSFNHESYLDDILNGESLDTTSTDTVEARRPEVHVVDVVKQREELYLREKLLKAALLKKMEASNDKITLRKLEREVISSRRSINRELTSLLSEMVKMSDLKVVLKSRQDKVISLREQLYKAEQQLNHSVSQLQTRETRRKSLTARVIEMRKRCVDLVKNCRLQGSKIDPSYKVPSGDHLEMKSKLVEVRNQNLVFQRENLKLKMSPRKNSFLDHQGSWKAHHRKFTHMSATLAAASRVKKSFNTCLKGKRRVGLSNSVYDPVKSKFKLPTTPQLKSPVRRPNNCRHVRKKSLTSIGSPMLLTKHGKTAQGPWDGESVFLLPKMLFKDVLTQEESPRVKYKSVPIIPYSIYRSPLESIRKQKKQISDSNTTPGLIKNVDPFVTLCYFELRGMCNSSKCAFQHLYRPQCKVTK